VNCRSAVDCSRSGATRARCHRDGSAKAPSDDRLVQHDASALDGKDPIETYMENTIIFGTPEEVADKLIELRETIGLDYLIASPLSHETFAADRPRTAAPSVGTSR
jgi:alkanesulfonate monooxygenase SsuD/methylene tetrahydromethanopterin reductase-like flavin-dependent oxidoreductase (luciferase family)